jgi:hypothetical protein
MDYAPKKDISRDSFNEPWDIPFFLAIPGSRLYAPGPSVNLSFRVPSLDMSAPSLGALFPNNSGTDRFRRNGSGRPG